MKRLDHAYYEELIGAALDGELTAEQERELHAHLTQCESCRTFYEAVKAVSQTIRDDEPPVPEGFTGRVMDAVRHTAAEPPKKKGKLLRFPVRAAAVAAAAMLVLWAGFRILPSAGAKSAQAPMMSLYSTQESAAAGAASRAMPAAEEPAPESEEAPKLTFDAPAAAADGQNAKNAPAEILEEETAPEDAGQPILTVRGGEILLNGEGLTAGELAERLDALEPGTEVTLAAEDADGDALEAVLALLAERELTVIRPEG